MKDEGAISNQLQFSLRAQWRIWGPPLWLFEGGHTLGSHLGFTVKIEMYSFSRLSSFKMLS